MTETAAIGCLSYLEYWRVTALESRCRDFSFWWNQIGVSGELLFRVTTAHVTLIRPKRPADAHPLNVADFKGIRAGWHFR